MQEAAHAAIFLLKPAGFVTVRITERAAVKIQGLLSFMADEARRSCHGSPLLCVLRPAAKARKHEFVPYGLQSLHDVKPAAMAASLEGKDAVQFLQLYTLQPGA